MEAVICRTVSEFNILYNVRDQVTFDPERNLTYNQVPEFKKVYAGRQDGKYMIVDNRNGDAIYYEIPDDDMISTVLSHLAMEKCCEILHI